MTLKRVAPFLFVSALLLAQPLDPALFSGMRWRLIGPFRGGRAVGVAGVRTQPEVFYFGSVGGGVWKTVNAGTTWSPIFDSEPLGSIGAIAVAPSDPNIIYVGTGEADMRSQISYGNGMYKSTDGGRTWSHIGLEGTRQIGHVVTDPANPDRVFVAALGHAYGANPERGIFRTTDGGRSWQKLLYRDENVGAIDVAFDPGNSNTLYATLWATRRPPWNVYPPANLPGSGLYKSTDGGNHWQPLTQGLPADGLGKIGIAVAPSMPNRVYAIVDAHEGGLYRSDDAGATWKLMDSERRIWQRGWYFCEVSVDPKNPDKLYVMNTSTYRSVDGGKTFDAIKGAPGGDDYHQLWINPSDPDKMILSSDQGVVVSVDGARSWSSWNNQPTAELYHVTADNRFPYWVYGAQQDSGARAVASRATSGNISFREWGNACTGGESGYIAADPLSPAVLYGSTVSKCDQTTGANENISPLIAFPDMIFRHTWTLPVVFSMADKHALYFSNQYLFKTTDGGKSWNMISPDLTREAPGAPPNLDAVTAKHGNGGPSRGVIYTIAPSPIRADMLWVGTDDGLIHVTRDGGKTWKNVTPPELTPWSKVALMDASHFDPDEAFAAVDRHRLEDQRPYIYRTRDGGASWKNITQGLPDDVYVNAVKEDPVRKGLLFAGTETSVWISFNDGDDWQSLQLNLPKTSMRDFVIHGDDVVVATHGRSFWILDDISALRQASASMATENAALYRPAAAIRIRAGRGGGGGGSLQQVATNLDPVELSAGENPPAGASIDYFLKSASSEPVTLEILDGSGQTVRRYSSANRAPQQNPRNSDLPAAWARTPEPLSASAGQHRFYWDLHYTAPAGAGRGGRGAGGGGGRGGGGGPWALPGDYTVKLTAGGKSYTQPLTVKMDPRVSASMSDLQKQLEMTRQVAALASENAQARREAEQIRGKLRALLDDSKAQALVPELRALDQKIAAISGTTVEAPPDATGVAVENSDRSSFLHLGGSIGAVEAAVQSGDGAPTGNMTAAFEKVRQIFGSTMGKWTDVKGKDIPALNQRLRQNGLPELAP